VKKLIAVCIAAALSLQPLAQASAKDNPVSLKEKAQTLASALLDNYGVSGLQYAIMDHGSIVLSDSAGVSDRAAGTPITKDTMFGIGSVSKMYVTAAVMILVDAKQVDIDQPLTAYIKDFKMADVRYKQITPRMLMNHSSGLYGSHYGNSMLFDDNDTVNHDDLLRRLKSERLKSDPGEYSVYCNDGFQLLELLVERVSGLSYSEFLEKYISDPLDLDFTKTPLDEFDRNQLARTYYPVFERALPVENANVLGAGGLYSTAEELTKFADALIGNRTDVLSEQSVKEMQSEEYRKGTWISEDANAFNYGLGWDAVHLAPFNEYGITALSKGGDTVLYHADMTTIPEYDISIALLTSGGSSLFNSVFTTNILLEYLKDKGLIQDILPDRTFEAPVQVTMPSDEQANSGLYAMVGETLNVEIEDGEIDLPALIGGFIPQQKYVYTGDGQFTSSDGSATISFEQQENGITYLKLGAYLSFPGLGQILMLSYEYQKLDRNPLNAATKKAWDNRHGKNYYAVDEKITSLFYLAPAVIAKHISVDTDYGHANGTRIVDKNKAVNEVEIPIMNGRDAFDLNFYQAGRTEYLLIDGFSYISEDAITPIYGGRASFCTIQANGHAVWYKIDGKSANKTMTVDIPEGGGFAVYDAAGMLVNFSVATQDNSVVLPEGGLIVFGGNSGAKFSIQLSK